MGLARVRRADISEYSGKPTAQGKRRLRREARRWVVRRAEAYEDEGYSPEDAADAACADCRERYAALDPRWFEIINKVLDALLPVLIELLRAMLV